MTGDARTPIQSNNGAFASFEPPTSERTSTVLRTLHRVNKFEPHHGLSAPLKHVMATRSRWSGAMLKSLRRRCAAGDEADRGHDSDYVAPRTKITTCPLAESVTRRKGTP